MRIERPAVYLLSHLALHRSIRALRPSQWINIPSPAAETQSGKLDSPLEVSIHSLLMLESSRRERSVTIAFAVLLLGITLASRWTVGLPAATLHGPAFFTAYDMLSACFDWATAYLIISQFRLTGSPTLLCIGVAYLFTGGMAVLHLLSVPGLLFYDAVFGTSNSSLWIRVCWFLGLPLGASASAASFRRFGTIHHPRRAIVAACTITLLSISVVFALMSTWAIGLFPDLTPKPENFRATYFFVFPLIFSAQFIAVTTLCRSTRGRSLLDLRLMLTVLAGMSEFVIGWVLLGVLPGRRYSFNFYLARFSGMASSSVLLFALLDSIRILYGKLAAGQRTLERRVADRTSELRATIAQRDQLLQESRRWADAFRFAPIGISFQDPAAEAIAFVNPAYAASCGISVDEAQGMRLVDAFPREEHPRLSAFLAEADRTGYVTCETRFIRKDRSTFPVEMAIASIHDPNGSVIYRVASSLDITERHENEREKERQRHRLERSNADLESFAYVASHDLKAPLRAIMHLADWIGEDIEATASTETAENLKLLRGRAERLQMLLDGLLAYSRVGREQLELEELDIAALVGDIVAVTPPPPGFVVGCGIAMPSIRTHGTPLRMVLDNLITNAWKHHDLADGRITIGMYLIDGVTKFRVSDDGPGISPRFHETIFGIFQTLVNRDEVEASGIGLALAKKVIENHGGRIWVESAPPKRGSTFVFTWQGAPE